MVRYVTVSRELKRGDLGQSLHAFHEGTAMLSKSLSRVTGPVRRFKRLAQGRGSRQCSCFKRGKALAELIGPRRPVLVDGHLEPALIFRERLYMESSPSSLDLVLTT